MKIRKIALDKLMLSVNNPRLDYSFEEIEAIEKMIKDQKEKLYVLASDIVEYGLNPLDLVAVYPSDNYDGMYIVVEGNRRICTLKLLQKPQILKELHQDKLYLKFLSLNNTSTVNFDSISIALFDNKEDVNHWMEIRHLGEQKGKGISKWDSKQKDRYATDVQGKNTLSSFWDWLVDKEILTKSQISEITKTNWERILRVKYFPFLKIEKINGKLVVKESDIDVFAERIKEIHKTLAGQTVGKVYAKEEIDKFYNNIAGALYNKSYAEVIDNGVSNLFENYQSDEDNKTDFIEEPALVHTLEKKSDNQSDNDIVMKNQNKGNRDIFNGCLTVIPYGFNIKSANMRLNSIISELKRLDPDKYPNACGTLLRALFELSAKAYLEHEFNEDRTERDFKQSITLAANTLIKKNKISKEEHSAIMKDVDSIRILFNGYMHKTDLYPSSSAIKGLFKAHRTFLKKCLES